MVLYLSPILYLSLLALPLLTLGVPNNEFELVGLIKRFACLAILLGAFALVRSSVAEYFSQNASERTKVKTYLFVAKFLVLVALVLICLQLLRIEAPQEAFVMLFAAIALAGLKSSFESRQKLSISTWLNVFYYSLASSVFFLLHSPTFIWQTAVLSLFTGTLLAGYEASRLLSKHSIRPTRSGKAKEVLKQLTYSKWFVHSIRILTPLPFLIIGGMVVFEQLPQHAALVFLALIAMPKMLPALPAASTGPIELPARYLEQAFSLYCLCFLIFTATLWLFH